MPELPEVEIVKQSLNKKIKYKKIKKVIIRNRNLRSKIPINFANFFKNQKIIKVDRFSKYLILTLSNKIICLIHLGMSGTIHYINRNKKNLVSNLSFYSSVRLPIKHNHIEIEFDNSKIIYNDPRRFGFFEILKKKQLLKKRLSHLGPEPMSDSFNIKYVFQYFKNKKKNIKNFLLDQRFVSGIGNIYASEILFLCGIKPDKIVTKLDENKCKMIIDCSKKILTEAIKKGGSSIRDFKNISGKKGTFQKIFKVYDREGLKCKKIKCKGVIQKKMISNRSTFFCNSCQK